MSANYAQILTIAARGKLDSVPWRLGHIAFIAIGGGVALGQWLPAAIWYASFAASVGLDSWLAHRYLRATERGDGAAARLAPMFFSASVFTMVVFAAFAAPLLACGNPSGFLIAVLMGVMLLGLAMSFSSGNYWYIWATSAPGLPLILVAPLALLAQKQFADWRDIAAIYLALVPILSVLARGALKNLEAARNLVSARNEAMRQKLEADKKRKEAEEASRVKEQFIANMSHELRTPLNAILGYNDLVADELESAGLKEAVQDSERVRRAGRHLLELIDGVLDLSRISTGEIQTLSEDIDVARFVEEVFATTADMFARKGLGWTFTVDPEISHVCSDPRKLRECLMRVVSNAAKFTEKGEARLGARRERVGESDWVAFTVEDTGLGMDDAQLSRLFQPFAQADSSKTRAQDGAGLGLLVTREVLRHLGGEIHVRSAPGVGSTFTLLTPCSLAAEPLSAGHETDADEARLISLVA